MVSTTADEKLEIARNSVDTALKALSEILIDKCWGHDEYNEYYKKQLNESFVKLMNLREVLEGRK